MVWLLDAVIPIMGILFVRIDIPLMITLTMGQLVRSLHVKWHRQV